MARNFNNWLSGQIGENLVVSELGKRGIVATTFAGNLPDIDILAYSPNGKSCPLQVKSWRRGAVSFDMKKFLDIEFKEDKERKDEKGEKNLQFVIGKNEAIDRNLIMAFVRINEGEADRFFIITQGRLQDHFLSEYGPWLNSIGNRRKRNPQSTHSAIDEKGLGPFENHWGMIEDRLS